MRAQQPSEIPNILQCTWPIMHDFDSVIVLHFMSHHTTPSFIVFLWQYLPSPISAFFLNCRYCICHVWFLDSNCLFLSELFFLSDWVQCYSAPNPYLIISQMICPQPEQLPGPDSTYTGLRSRRIISQSYLWPLLMFFGRDAKIFSLGHVPV